MATIAKPPIGGSMAAGQGKITLHNNYTTPQGDRQGEGRR